MSMEYSLARELKEAGFPIRTACEAGPDCHQWWYFPGKEAIHAPTLSELIEALVPEKGDEFSIYKSGAGWEVRYQYYGFFEGFPLQYVDEEGFASVDIKIHGNTPEEAVARLWLTLNKK